MPLHVLIVFILSLPVVASENLKGVDLWLPGSYQNHYLLFVEAAKKAKSDPYCHQLLSGKLNEAKSNQAYLHFHFRCRADDRTMFSIQIEGPELKLTNLYGKEKEEMEAKRQAELERIAAEKEATIARLAAEEQEELKKEQDKYWGICRKALKKRLKYFDKPQILTKIPPKPDIQDLEFTYVIDFDALSPARKPLQFKAWCVISGLEAFQVKVKPRKKI